MDTTIDMKRREEERQFEQERAEYERRASEASRRETERASENDYRYFRHLY